MSGESAGLVPRSVMQIFDTIVNGSVSGVWCGVGLETSCADDGFEVVIVN